MRTILAAILSLPLAALLADPALATQFCVDIPAAQVPRVRAALCDLAQWKAILPNGQPNGETCLQAAQRFTKDWMRSVTVEYEGDQAAASARATVRADAESNVPSEATPTPDGDVWTPTPAP